MPALFGTPTTNTIGANGGSVSVLSGNSATTGVQISGTWAGTLAFQGSVDGANFFALNATPYTTGAAVTSTTANGQWQINSAGLCIVQVIATAWTSGSATVALLPSVG